MVNNPRKLDNGEFEFNVTVNLKITGKNVSHYQDSMISSDSIKKHRLEIMKDLIEDLRNRIEFDSESFHQIESLDYITIESELKSVELKDTSSVL